MTRGEFHQSESQAFKFEIKALFHLGTKLMSNSSIATYILHLYNVLVSRILPQLEPNQLYYAIVLALNKCCTACRFILIAS